MTFHRLDTPKTSALNEKEPICLDKLFRSFETDAIMIDCLELCPQNIVGVGFRHVWEFSDGLEVLHSIVEPSYFGGVRMRDSTRVKCCSQ